MGAILENWPNLYYLVNNSKKYTEVSFSYL